MASSQAKSASLQRIAFLHQSPTPCDRQANIRSIAAAIGKAADHGARWVLTPELATTGYTFAIEYGTDWIGIEHDAAIEAIVAKVAETDVTLFLGMPERDPTTGALYNTLRVIDRHHGSICTHRKINALRVGSEAWSSTGSIATVADLPDFGPVGLLICADACATRIGEVFRRRGVRAIVSASNWAVGEWGPAGEWERLSRQADIPVFNCNRTGQDAALSFETAESVIASGGTRVMSVASADPIIIFADWDFAAGQLIGWFSRRLR